MSDVFRSLTEAHKRNPAWLEWFRKNGVQVDHLVWDGNGWIERRDTRILYLAHGTRDGEDIYVQNTIQLHEDPPDFPC